MIKRWLVMLMCACVATIAGAVQHTPIRHSDGTGPLRIVVIGLTHGHAEGLLWNAANRDDIELVGVYEPNRALFERLAAKYGMADDLHYNDLAAMLDSTTPEAASVMTSIAGHLEAVEACAPRGVHTLIEKPLAFTNKDAARMAGLSRAHGVLVLTNYETSWYASLRETKRLLNDGAMAPVRRMVFRHGHKGPIEIGCGPEFVEWLTDPAESGGGALVDFGCYGAILATWLMDGRRPNSVVASAHTVKPGLYPQVDDDATIVLAYDAATAVIQASWAWTHDNKEADIHTEGGSIHAGKWDTLAVRPPDAEARIVSPPSKPEHLRDEWTYLRQAVRGECEVDPLSGLELNLIVVEILDEARRQVATAGHEAHDAAE